MTKQRSSEILGDRWNFFWKCWHFFGKRLIKGREKISAKMWPSRFWSSGSASAWWYDIYLDNRRRHELTGFFNCPSLRIVQSQCCLTMFHTDSTMNIYALEMALNIRHESVGNVTTRTAVVQCATKLRNHYNIMPLLPISINHLYWGKDHEY